MPPRSIIPADQQSPYLATTSIQQEEEQLKRRISALRAMANIQIARYTAKVNAKTETEIEKCFADHILRQSTQACPAPPSFDHMLQQCDTRNIEDSQRFGVEYAGSSQPRGAINSSSMVDQASTSTTFNTSNSTGPLNPVNTFGDDAYFDFDMSLSIANQVAPSFNPRQLASAGSEVSRAPGGPSRPFTDSGIGLGPSDPLRCLVCRNELRPGEQTLSMRCWLCELQQTF